jgi:hypothetical protein
LSLPWFSTQCFTGAVRSGPAPKSPSARENSSKTTGDPFALGEPNGSQMSSGMMIPEFSVYSRKNVTSFGPSEFLSSPRPGRSTEPLIF